jgi:hypothetical protein
MGSIITMSRVKEQEKGALSLSLAAVRRGLACAAQPFLSRSAEGEGGREGEGKTTVQRPPEHTHHGGLLDTFTG